MQQTDKPKILIVDDKNENLLLLEGILDTLDVEIISADSGEKGLAKASKHEFALIISDIQMPRMSGYEMLQNIRRIKSCENIPFIFVSGIYKEEDDILKGIQNGAIDFIAKPFNIDILLGKVELYLKLYYQKKNLDLFIDELNIKNKQLEESRLLIQKITDSVVDAIIMVNDNGKIIFWNKAAEKIFGYTVEEAKQSDIFSLLMCAEYLAESKKEIKNNIKSLLDNDIGQIPETYARRKDDVVIPVEYTIAPIIVDDKKYAVGIVRDITERRENERKLLEVEQEKEANKAKSEFIANMSHEFRTPMNAIIGISKALLKYDSSNLNQEQIEGLTHINQGGVRLLDLVNDLLDLSKIESKKMTVTLKPFSLEKMLTDLKSLTEELIKEKNLVFSVRKSQNIADYLVSDQKKIYQVLVNLLGNAVKFTEKGKIQLHVYKLKTHLFFEVSDTGIGINKNNINKVFEKFIQIDSSAQKKYKGTGLGLALCKELVTLLNGEIYIESELNEGTVVKFFVPYQSADGDHPDNEAELFTEENEFSKMDKILVLLIEDDHELRYYYKKYLSKNDIVLDFARDGKAGLEKIKTTRPDIIVLDIKLPFLTGYEILRILKFDQNLWNIPVILISELDEKLSEAFYNYDVFLHKPVDEKILFSNIQKIINFKKINSERVLIISENIKELKFLKKVFQGHHFVPSTLPESRKSRIIIEKFEPDIILVDLDNLLFDILEFVKINLSRHKEKKSLVIFYAEKIENPELVSFIHYREEIVVVLKTPSARSTLSRIINRFTYAHGNIQAKVSKLLIVDDNDESIHTLKMLLRERYDVVVAHDGKEAVDLFMLEKPDLVLMDIQMPEVNGFFAFDEIRRKSTRTDIPIIAVTAHAMPDEREEIINHGFNDYISKPIDDELLFQILDKYIET